MTNAGMSAAIPPSTQNTMNGMRRAHISSMPFFISMLFIIDVQNTIADETT